MKRKLTCRKHYDYKLLPSAQTYKLAKTSFVIVSRYNMKLDFRDGRFGNRVEVRAVDNLAPGLDRLFKRAAMQLGSGQSPLDGVFGPLPAIQNYCRSNKY